jgi:hypothetical protein
LRRTSFGVNAPWRGCAEIYFLVWEVNVDRSIERRRTIRIRRSALTSAKLDDIEKPAIKIAETKDELFNAFRLVYSEYQDQGYITKSHPLAIQYNVFNFLPKTCVFIFQSYRDVVSTISYIPDTPLFGLPLDSLYREEVDLLSSPLIYS